MSTISIILGWVLVAFIIVMFTDVVGVVRAKVYRERTIKAEFIQRHIKLKLCFFTLFVFTYLFLK